MQAQRELQCTLGCPAGHRNSIKRNLREAGCSIQILVYILGFVFWILTTTSTKVANVEPQDVTLMWHLFTLFYMVFLTIRQTQPMLSPVHFNTSPVVISVIVSPPGLLDWNKVGKRESPKDPLTPTS